MLLRVSDDGGAPTEEQHRLQPATVVQESLVPASLDLEFLPDLSLRRQLAESLHPRPPRQTPTPTPIPTPAPDPPTAEAVAGYNEYEPAGSKPTIGDRNSRAVVAAIIEEVFGATADKAKRVAECESTFGQNPSAYHEGRKFGGLFQIWTGQLGPSLPANTNLYDDRENARAAYLLSRGGTSWGPWPYCGRQ